MPRPAKMDAVALLKADHRKVEELFESFEKAHDADRKEKLVKQICTELVIHAQIEEEIFYPAVREAIEETDLLDEAEVEHASAKDLIAQLSTMAPGDELYDAKVTVLGEYVNHHISEEQDEMFPQAKKAELDTASLGAELLERKQELQAEIGVGADDDDESAEEAAETQAVAARKSAARSTKARAQR